MTTASAPSREFDLAWLRWPVTVCALLTAANVFYSNVTAQWIAAITNTAFGVLLSLYCALDKASRGEPPFLRERGWNAATHGLRWLSTKTVHH
jgi:hypothetical protein